MQDLIFCQLGLKTPIVGPNVGCLKKTHIDECVMLTPRQETKNLTNFEYWGSHT